MDNCKLCQGQKGASGEAQPRSSTVGNSYASGVGHVRQSQKVQIRTSHPTAAELHPRYFQCRASTHSGACGVHDLAACVRVCEGNRAARAAVESEGARSNLRLS